MSDITAEGKSEQTSSSSLTYAQVAGSAGVVRTSKHAHFSKNVEMILSSIDCIFGDFNITFVVGNVQETPCFDVMWPDAILRQNKNFARRGRSARLC